MVKTVKKDKKFDLNTCVTYWYPQLTLTGNFSSWVGYKRRDIYTDLLTKWTNCKHVTKWEQTLKQHIIVAPHGKPVAGISLYDETIDLYSIASDFYVDHRDMSEGLFTQDDCEILTTAVDLLDKGWERSTQGQRLWYPRSEMVCHDGRWIHRSDLEPIAPNRAC